MTRRWKLMVLCGALSGAITAGCGTQPVDGDGGPSPSDARADARPGADTGVGMCAAGDDADEDGIADRYEGTGDADNDGRANRLDDDSDGDGRTDTLEANAGRVYDCSRAPLDSDSDGTPDFLDTDSDGNGRPDAAEFVGTGEAPEGGWPAHPRDLDRDGTPDYADNDDDGDTIPDRLEIGDDPMAPVDSDSDGTPDYQDLDSDGDSIADAAEGSQDSDHDMVSNFRDDDSDGDGITDRDEAGDSDVNTPPQECARELDAATLSLASPMPDGIRDFLDNDSDNDGLSDREEAAAGTDRCNPDSDGDGQLDSAETAWCTAHMRTGCATQSATTIPSTDYYLVLPNNGPVVQRELEFGTNIRVADVFFIFDTTGSMSGVQQGVANSIAAPMTGMVDQIRSVIPDTYFGVGHYDDFLAGSYGCGREPNIDRPIHPLCDGPPGSRSTPECSSGTYGGITMQPPSMAMAVQAGAQAIPRGCGADGPESQVEALYQIVTNEGLYDRSAPSACAGAVGMAPCWVRPTACGEGTWGYPCFRDGALAIVVHFTDAPFHNGARDESPPSTTYYDPYMGISPTPHNFDQMVMAYQRRSARQISIAASARCEGRLFTNHSTGGPCYDYRKVAEGTGSVDLDGNPLIYDLPEGAGTGTPPAEFVGLVTEAVRTLATRVPIDINTTTRNDPMNPHMVDARRFITRRVPSCQIAPVNDRCWDEPTGVAHRAAVSRTDLSTFYRVVPGTRVRFTIFFQNAGVFEGDPSGITLFHAYIDVVGDGVTRLDTREVYILVPARPIDIG